MKQDKNKKGLLTVKRTAIKAQVIITVIWISSAY